MFVSYWCFKIISELKLLENYLQVPAEAYKINYNPLIWKEEEIMINTAQN